MFVTTIMGASTDVAAFSFAGYSIGFGEIKKEPPELPLSQDETQEKIEQEEVQVHRNTFDFLDIVKQSKKTLHFLADEKDVDISLDYNDKELSIEEIFSFEGNRMYLQNAINNLLKNASDAMQNIGQVTVKTENYYADDTALCFGRVPKGEYVKLTVTDNGCGIPEEIVHKILDPFYLIIQCRDDRYRRAARHSRRLLQGFERFDPSPLRRGDGREEQARRGRQRGAHLGRHL